MSQNELIKSPTPTQEEEQDPVEKIYFEPEEIPESKKKEKDEDESNSEVLLQLGDVLRLDAPTNDLLNDQTFIIDYLDANQVRLVNVKTFQLVPLKIHENGVLGDGTIVGITLIYRNEEPGYARQNHLLPGTWVNLYFGGDIPAIITGEITNLEEDMIEIQTYPDKDVIYLNFAYQGLPLDIPLENIEIREPPEKETKKETKKEIEEEQASRQLEESEEQKEILEQKETRESKEKDEESEIAPKEQLEQEETDAELEEFIPMPVADIKDQVREFILRANEIQFGEELGPIVQYEEVDISQKRYTIEMQANDLLEELLSTIPSIQRTNSVLNNIHIMIERFKQLRAEFSQMDAYGNVLSSIQKGVEWKPLQENLRKFKQALAWILPVAKNMKKVYDVNPNEETEYSDIVALHITEDIKNMRNVWNQYKSNDFPEEQNKYVSWINEWNPYCTPFENPNQEFLSDILCETEVESDIMAILDNLTDLESSVVEKESIQTKKWVIQKYNLGLQKLDVEQMTGSKMLAQRVSLTPSDTIAVKSLLTLPEPVIRYSRIALPTTNIMERANLNTTPLNYWQLLNDKTNAKNIFVDSSSSESGLGLATEEDVFLQGIRHYIWTPDMSQPKPDKDTYDLFLKKVIPKTRVIFQQMKKYITGKLSFLEVVNALSPFLVYTKDITFKQYEEINKFLIEKISLYNKRFVERSREFSLISRLEKESSPPSNSAIQRLIHERKLSAEVWENYTFPPTVPITNAETLLIMTKEDDTRLYSNALSLENLDLMIPENIGYFLEETSRELQDKMKKAKEKQADLCITYTLAKQYSHLEEIEADNGRPIYFDKKYDHTMYSLLDDYKKEQMNMDPEAFRLFLQEKLLKKHGVLPQYVESMTETLIRGMRPVENGHYAVLYDRENMGADTFQMRYFKRVNNRWEPDTSLTPDQMADNESMLCNLQQNCIEVTRKYDAICEPMDINKKTIEQNALQEMIHEFDKTYHQSKEQLQQSLEQEYAYSLSIQGRLKDLATERKYKYNLQQVRLGLKIEEEDMEIVKSPYQNLRDLILGQSDFVKKQWDIQRFAIKYTREALRTASEDEHWRYCIQTNVKLLPTFLYELAGVWCENPDMYVRKMDLIIKEIGTLSEDGDTWVDKYSGYVIKQIDYDTEEGYEAGFRIRTRDILEQDAGNAILNAKQKSVEPQSPLTKMIHNIIHAVSGFMGISIEEQKEFIVRIATNTIQRALPVESTYQTTIEEMAKKGKAIPSYKMVYNLTVLYLSLGALLIGIQTSIPSIRTRKTFPGCVRSFDGYPFQGSGDVSALRYITCIVYKIKNSTEPWNTLNKTKEDKIFEKLKTFIDTYLLVNDEVIQKFQEKNAYILSNPPELVPKEHDLSKWLGFLPPLVKFQLKPFPQPISPAFKKTLTHDLRTGSRIQREKLLVVESRIYQFSLAIQERIQKILDKKKLLLTNAVNEPFLENACCNEKERRGLTVLQYFEKEDKEIVLFNQMVSDLSNLMYDVQALTKAPFFFSRENSKIQYPPISNDFNEDTIYQAFMVMCKFHSAVPIPADLLAVCTDKPDYLNITDSISEKIRKLKEDGRKYTQESLMRLLQVVNKNNMVTVSLDSHTITLIQKMRDVLENINHEEDEVVQKTLVQKLEAILDTFHIGVANDSEEMRSLKNYISRSNTEMKKEITDFLLKDGRLSKKQMRETMGMLEQLWSWETASSWRNQTTTISDDATYNSLQFIKVYMQNILKTFPNMILEKVDHTNAALPKYWGLSARHTEDIRQMLLDYYRPLNKFYDNALLINVLQRISSKCDRLLLLAEETPYLSEITYRGKSMHSIFDKRTSNLLMEHYFLLALLEYKKLALDPGMVNRVIVDKEEEELWTVEEMEERELRLSEPSLNAFTAGEQKQLRVLVADLLLAYLSMMEDHKDMIDLRYERVMDLVFKTKEKEKDTFTDRLQALTEEERQADTILKINKLGIWSKGLQKGLTTYVKETYDEEREYMEKLAEIERQVKKNKYVTDNNLEQYLDDYMEEQETGRQIEQEEYDLNGLTEDYMDGDYFGQEEEHFEDYE